jgi:hypothetical protein
MLIIKCSFNVAGASETINTKLTIAERQGVIKSGASVRLIDPESWMYDIAKDSSAVLYSDTTDTSGNIAIPEEIIKKYKNVNVLIDCQNKGAFSKLKLYPNFKNDTIYLEMCGELNGAMVFKGEPPEYVALMGTDYKAPFNAQTSEFKFPSVPPGSYTLISVSRIHSKKIRNLADAGTEVINEGEIVESSYQCDYNSLLIDNFDHEGYWSPLSKFQKMAYWYIIKEKYVEVTFPTTREIDTTYVTVVDALVSDDAYRGKSFHLEYNPFYGTQSYLIPGVRVGFDNIGFSNIDTVSFMAKGNDQLTLRLHGDEIYWDKPQALYKVTLDSVWRLYKIPTSTMLIIDPMHIYTSWDVVKSKLYWLTFGVEGRGTSIWIDDVKFNNATINDLLFQ